MSDIRRIRLGSFRATLDRGASKLTEAAWLACQPLVASPLPGSGWRTLILRAFGAAIGQGVVIKPRVRVKFPWRLSVGPDSWIGEAVWIDNLAAVEIGADCCISQGAYLCTGSHDWASSSFDLLLGPIRIETESWIAARSVVAPNVVVGQGCVLTLGSVLLRSADPWGIYRGNPASRVAERRVKSG